MTLKLIKKFKTESRACVLLKLDKSGKPLFFMFLIFTVSALSFVTGLPENIFRRENSPDRCCFSKKLIRSEKAKKSGCHREKEDPCKKAQACSCYTKALVQLYPTFELNLYQLEKHTFFHSPFSLSGYCYSPNPPPPRV